MPNNNDSQDGYAETLSGGTVRYTAGGFSRDNLSIGMRGDNQAQPSFGGHASGNLQHTAGVGMEQRAYASVNAGVLIDESSVLGTYRDAGGSPSGNHKAGGSVELEPGNSASRTGIDAALLQGFVKKAADGSYVDGKTLDQAKAGVREMSTPKQAEEVPYDLFAPEAERQYAEMLAPYRQDSTDTAHVVGSMAAVQGQDINSIAIEVGKQLAQSEGGDPAFHTANAAKAAVFYQHQVRGVAAAAGIAPEVQGHWHDWLRSTPQNQDLLSQAMVQLTAGRSTKAFKDLAVRFLTQGSPSGAYLKEAGIPTRRGGPSGLEAQINGEWVDAAGLRFEHGY